MAMHPADLSEADRKYWNEGFAALDVLLVRGFNAQQITYYIQGLRARLEEEQYKALHPGMFRGARGDGV